jgi:hypothetical protein
MCLSVKHILTNGEECKGLSPMTSKCTHTLGVTLVPSCKCLEPWLERKKNTKLDS